jgi:hypothetical protein
MFSAGVFWSRCCEWIAVGLSFVSGKECEATRVGEMNNEPVSGHGRRSAARACRRSAHHNNGTWLLFWLNNFYVAWAKWGLGSMCGHRENAEKFNTKIMQPLKKLPILLWLSSTSQALCGYQALFKHVITHFSSTYETILKHF